MLLKRNHYCIKSLNYCSIYPTFYTETKYMNTTDVMSTLEEAIRYILDETGFGNVTLRSATDTSKPSDLVITTGITGALRGIFMMRFGNPEALAAANTMLEHVGQPHEGSLLDESHKASLSEMTNLCTGRFVNLLSAKDMDCNLTPPSIITGTGIGISIRNIEYASDLEVNFDSRRFFISLYVISTLKA